jgi:hypothetical protein
MTFFQNTNMEVKQLNNYIEFSYSYPENGRVKQVRQYLETVSLSQEEIRLKVRAKAQKTLLFLVQKYLKHRYEVYITMQNTEKTRRIQTILSIVNECKNYEIEVLASFIATNPIMEGIEPKKPNCWTTIMNQIQSFIKSHNYA